MPHPARTAALTALAVALLAAAPAGAQIRNAPAPRALEFAAYIFAASNVCGYRIGTEAFEALLAKQNARPEDVAPRGPFGNRVHTMFALMSNQMALNREQACLAVAGEYGPEGNVAKNVLLPAQAPAGQTPADQAPAGQAPAGQTPADQAPAGQAPAAPPTAPAPKPAE